MLHQGDSSAGCTERFNSLLPQDPSKDKCKSGEIKLAEIQGILWFGDIRLQGNLAKLQTK